MDFHESAAATGISELQNCQPLIAKEKVTFSHCVPTILSMLLASPACEGADLTNWTVTIGDSALPSALAKAALDRGIDVFTGYGMSETCPVLSLAHVETADLADDNLQIRTKTGRPNLLVDLRAGPGALCWKPCPYERWKAQQTCTA